MNYMAEYLLGNLTHENRMILVQYVFIITLVYLVVIILIIGIGQRTRILTPSNQSKIRIINTIDRKQVSYSKSKYKDFSASPSVKGNL